MLECLLASHGAVVILALLLILSEALGETHLVKSNGVLSFFFDFLSKLIRILKKALHK